jgi:hypothetical protein
MDGNGTKGLDPVPKPDHHDPKDAQAKKRRLNRSDVEVLGKHN